MSEQRHSPITLGALLRSSSNGHLIITETKHAAGLTLQPHSHERASISCVLEGSFLEATQNECHECQVATVLMKPGGEIHSNRYGSQGARTLIVELKQDLLNLIQEIPSVSIFLRTECFPGGILSALAMKLYKEFRAQDGASILGMEGLVLEMMYEACKASAFHVPNRIPSWLSKAKEFLHDNFKNGLTLLTVAGVAGVHPAHLARAFRRHYGITAGEYVRRLRVEWCTTQLLHSDREILDIALEAGFYDQSHFIRVFKSLTGFTPYEFRRSKRLVH
ncbi:AraC family transcriptional regulator [bacterium]|nr:AraC family transcriptional regulator [bacterium]